MSILLKKISFSIYNITQIKDEAEFLAYLNSLPPTDIKDEPIVQSYFFTDPIDTDRGGYQITDESLSFCFRIDKKTLPKKRLNALVNAEIERIKNEDGIVLDPKKDKQEIQQITFEIAKVMSVGQNPVENTVQVIIDRATGTLFIEKKGGQTEEVIGLLAYNGGCYCEKVLPFNGEDRAEKAARLTDFTSWLYQSMSNKSNYIESGSIKLGTSIKLQDEDSEVTIKGNITKYIKTYNTVMEDGLVKECRVFFEDAENGINLQYTLNCKDLYFSAYTSSGYAHPKNESLVSLDSIEERREDLIEFRNHFEKLASYFEEFSELEKKK